MKLCGVAGIMEWGDTEKIAKPEITFSLGGFASKDTHEMRLIAKCCDHKIMAADSTAVPVFQRGNNSPPQAFWASCFLFQLQSIWAFGRIN